MPVKLEQRTGRTIDVQKIIYSVQAQSYENILRMTQKYISEHCAEELAKYHGQEAETEKLLLEHIEKFLKDNKTTCDNGENISELSYHLFCDMAEYSFITRLNLLEMDGFEELNANSWDDIELITSAGMKKLNETFLGSSHALDIVKRMLTRRGITIDNQKPIAFGDLGKGHRITAMVPPIVDEECGVAFSLRRVDAAGVDETSIIEKGYAVPEELELLKTLARYKVSMIYGGGTGAGKTTAAAWLLSTMPDKIRIFSIEEGSREVNFTKRDEAGRVVSRVVHTLTRPSVNPEDNIDQTRLLTLGLRCHPKIIFMAEMRSSEAFAVQEAARTGHGVIGTAHTKSAPATWMRLMTLGKQAYPSFSDDTLMRMMIEAFPIVVYMKQLEDGSRRYMRIVEGEKYQDGEVVYRTLWNFVVEDTVTDENGFTKVIGHHERGDGISDQLYDELIENGCPRQLADKFHRGKDNG